MRTQRIVKSPPELDQRENEWWNQNSSIIETVWAHTYTLQRSIRYPYLKRAKAFLQNKGQRSVWEVGCGTGWVCRLIADKNFRVIGTDFSKEQIDTAVRQAIAFKKDAFCTYRLSDASTRIGDHDAIFIHALLHHLSEEELDRFFEVLQEQPPGMRVFMYEPVFPDPRSKGLDLGALLVKKLIAGYRKFANVLIKLFGKRDESLIKQTNFIFEQAEKNGWFLSPKEVPFYEGELDERLSRYFHINKKYFVNMTDYHLAMNLVLHNLGEPGFLFTKMILPFATWLDKLFFKLNFRSVSKGQYFFCCYELIKK